MADILADIDATADGRCACGCGVLLAVDGPSGWFASPECQQRFQARDATPAPAVGEVPVHGWALGDTFVVVGLLRTPAEVVRELILGGGA